MFFSPIRSYAVNFLLALTLPFLFCGCHIAHLAQGELHVQFASVPVEDALRDPAISDKDKDAIRYIQEVKTFAQTRLHLTETCNFTTYFPGPHLPPSYSVSASEKERLVPKTWWYPIAGTVSYDVFFDRALAQAEADELAASGYDTSVWPTGAYSTGGWFCDPIIPTMLDADRGWLAALIIHELVHSTLIIPGNTGFNESLADFVAYKGAPVFLEEKFGPGNAELTNLRNDLEVEGEVNDIIRTLAARLGDLYDAHPADVMARRNALFEEAKAAARQVCETHHGRDHLCRPNATLNNAVVLQRLTYGSPAPFERYYAASLGDWQVFFLLLRKDYEPRNEYPPASPAPGFP